MDYVVSLDSEKTFDGIEWTYFFYRITKIWLRQGFYWMD